MILKRCLKRLISRFLKPLAKWYLNSDRWYNYKGIRVRVFKGVFHPGLFFSTNLLLEYLDSLNLHGKTFFEPGAGSGLISIMAYKRGAVVTASDKSAKAIENIRFNFDKHHVQGKIFHSDLFDSIPQQHFDFIVINPPYYKKNPQTDEQLAWYCGENLEYFQKLFLTINNYANKQSTVIMVLSEDCDIDGIKKIAGANKFVLNLERKKRKLYEDTFIFEIKNGGILK